MDSKLPVVCKIVFFIDNCIINDCAPVTQRLKMIKIVSLETKNK